MSDYLWDKTGEPDEDVEQLENLLGALKYQPRPLEIPVTAMPASPRAPRTLFFSRPRLAIAASLLLMLLAGTWLVTRHGEPRADRIAKVEPGSPTPESKRPETAIVSTGGINKDASIKHANQAGEGEDKGVVKPPAPRRQRPPRQLLARRQKLQQPRVKDDAAKQREELAVSEEGREATRKLMLALRLASAKLNFAQRELHEISRAGQ